MRAIRLQPTVPAPPLWWSSLADILGLSRRQSRLFWAALSASTDPRMVALRFRCEQHEQYLRGARLDLLTDGRMLNTFLNQTWTPHTMVMCLERLFAEHLLSRQDCSALQERFLLRADKVGRWALPR